MFNPLYQPYNANRFCVTARNGMVATGSALASAAGLEILKMGGNAVDAAVATAATLTVVEPTANGIGSDAFAIVWMKDKMYGLNSTGYAPKNIDVEKIKSKYKTMPQFGWTPVTVPGAPKAWVALIERFGNLTLKEVLQPAIRYAEQGYPLSGFLASMYQKSTDIYKKEFKNDPKFNEWFKLFTKEGEPYKFGDMVILKDHAKTLKLIAETNADAFYKGEIAKQIVKQSNRDGGYFSISDLANFDVKWVDPISVNYKNYDIWEIPPNGQGIVALMGLNILNNFSFSNKECTYTYHKQFEAMKMAFADGIHYVTDPEEMGLDYHDLIKKEYGLKRAKTITEFAQEPIVDNPDKSGTVYLCTADKEGNMVSFIQSNYMGFGSGIVVEGYGITLQNRGADFSLDENHYNYLKPLKRTYHTIIPGFITKNDKAVGPFGVMGGYMQPQGHLQVVMNLIDFNLNPQQALDAPRWQWVKSKKFLVEHSFKKEIIQELIAKGHKIEIAASSVSFGRGQMIVRLENGVLVGGTESRTDSNISCY
jgi:gamma-glutamyltranspeptidase/glutathione hydrolase